MRKRPALILAAFTLVVIDVVILFFLLYERPRVLTVAFLDVGQGDAIFIESPTGAQMLIDGGRDRAVLRELGKQMSPLDRTIDVVVETHPDADHIGGLSDVFLRYEVGAFLTPGIEHDTRETEALDAAVLAEKETDIYVPRRGMRIVLGGGAYADILFPDRDVSGVEPNDGSVIMRVVYGDTAFFLSGDAPESVENHVVRLGGGLQSEVLKAGHHGSRTSTGQALLDATDPAFVVVSAGADNSYGHPHPDVLARVIASGAQVRSTMGQGAVVFVSDGTVITEK